MKKNVVSVKDLLQTCASVTSTMRRNNNHDKKQEKRWSKCTQLIESNNMQRKMLKMAMEIHCKDEKPQQLCAMQAMMVTFTKKHQ